MRGDKSHSGAFTNKLVSCLTSSGGGGLGRDVWHMTESHCIHSQELLLLVLLLAMGILKLSLRQYRAYVVDSLGLCLISLYYVYKDSDLVSLDLYAIPIFPF